MGGRSRCRRTGPFSQAEGPQACSWWFPQRVEGSCPPPAPAGPGGGEETEGGGGSAASQPSWASLPSAGPRANAWKLTRTPGRWEAPGRGGRAGSHRGAGLRLRCPVGRVWRRGSLAVGLYGVRAGTGSRDPRGEGAPRPPPFNWPRRPFAGEAGGGGPPLVGLVGQSLKVRRRRWGAVRAGLRSRPGGSAGPRPTE